ncbi:MAG TPA: NUDIX domain-containing protein [Rhodanobacteraceae bacterium]
MIPIECTMVSVLALRGHAETAELLAVRRAETYLRGAWSYVAGHVEPGETGWQAARRELLEETGLATDTWYATSFCEQFYLAATDHIEVVPAFVAAIDANAVVRLNPEHSAFRWVTFATAADLFPFGSQRDLLAHVQREFVAREPSAFLRVRPA